MKGQFKCELVFFINSLKTELQKVKDAPEEGEVVRRIVPAGTTLSRFGRVVPGDSSVDEIDDIEDDLLR